MTKTAYQLEISDKFSIWEETDKSENINTDVDDLYEYWSIMIFKK